MQTFKLGDIVVSKVNTVARGQRYRIVKMNKTTCWAETEYPLYFEDEDNNIHSTDKKPTLYKNVRYSILKLAS